MTDKPLATSLPKSNPVAVTNKSTVATVRKGLNITFVTALTVAILVIFLAPFLFMQMLLEGKAAAVLTDARAILTNLQEDTPATKNIGAASLMSTPWSGGGNLVIWRHTYGFPDRLEAAFKLADFLTRKSTMGGDVGV